MGEEWTQGMDEDSEDKGRDKMNVVEGRPKLEKVGRKKKKKHDDVDDDIK